MKRRNALVALYAGAWLASMELALELLLADALGGPFKLAARTAQLVGLGVALAGAWQLRRPLPDTVTNVHPELGPLMQAERIMNAYAREILTHLLMAGTILSVALAYAMVLYVRFLADATDSWYYLGIILSTFTALLAAWLLPVREMMREERRLRHATEAQHAG